MTVNSGGSQTFSFTPATGYQVSSVLVDGTAVTTASSYTFSSVSANHTISVSFASITYTITPTAGANGTISPSAAVTVNYGASQTFTITPATGYQVASVTVDGTSVGAVTSYTFSNVTANHTIAATFAINTYTITASAGSNGSISPSGPVSVARRRKPNLYDHSGHGLPGGERHGGRNFGRGSHELSFHQRHGQPHNRSDICNQYLHHHGLCRFKRLDLPFGSGLRERRRKPNLYDHSGHGLPGGERHGGRNFGRGSNELYLSPTSRPTTQSQRHLP